MGHIFVKAHAKCLEACFEHHMTGPRIRVDARQIFCIRNNEGFFFGDEFGSMCFGKESLGPLTIPHCTEDSPHRAADMPPIT